MHAAMSFADSLGNALLAAASVEAGLLMNGVLSPVLLLLLCSEAFWRIQDVGVDDSLIIGPCVLAKASRCIPLRWWRQHRYQRVHVLL